MENYPLQNKQILAVNKLVNLYIFFIIIKQQNKSRFISILAHAI